MAQLRDREPTLKSLGIVVRLITFDSPSMARTYSSGTGVEWPLLLDENAGLYQQYGMGKADAWTLYNPVALARYLYLILTGTRPGRPGKDLSQLGGDVLIDPQGIIRFHHACRTPLDRPRVEDLIEIVRESG